MFGSKKRAKAKAEKLQAAKRLEDVKKEEESAWYSTGYRYSVDPNTGLAKVEPKDFAMVDRSRNIWKDEPKSMASWDVPKENAKKEEKYWESVIEGSLDEENKFQINFDGEADLENLQMISSVLNLHIQKLQNEKYRKEAEEQNTRDREIQRKREETALYDKRLKEQREHELKVIVAKKEAGVPLVPTAAEQKIPNTHQLNGSTGKIMDQSVIEAYKQAQQMQSANQYYNSTKQYT